LTHRVANLCRLDAVRELDRIDDPTNLRQRPCFNRQVSQELVEDLVRRLSTRVRCQQRQQLLALTSLPSTPLSSLLEPCVLAHLRRATRPPRATRTTRPRATIAKRRARTTRATRPIAKGRTWATRATRPIAKRRARTRRAVAELRARARNARHWRRQPFQASAITTTTVRSTEPLTTTRWAATATLTAALTATAATATRAAGTASATTAATRPNRHVAAPTIVVVHPATVRALASATTLTVVV
jgi:hypothetical protein